MLLQGAGLAWLGLARPSPAPGGMPARGRALRGWGRQRELGPAGRAHSPGSDAPSEGEQARSLEFGVLSDPAMPGADGGSIFPLATFPPGRLCCIAREGAAGGPATSRNVGPVHELIAAPLPQGDSPRNLIVRV